MIYPLRELPVYQCKLIKREIQISGKIDDPAWEEASKIRLVDNVSGEQADQLTEVRILYSGTTLYISFFSEDDYIWGTHNRRDSPIFNEECVEVFLNPGNSNHQYFEINVSPRNTLFDACILSNRNEEKGKEKFIGLTEFNPEIRTLVHIEGEFGKPGKGCHWSVEYAIPFTELFGAANIIPQTGDQWRMNLYRIDCTREGISRYYAWSPTGIVDFHQPWKFGILEFTASPGD
jgi:hypothetical protein